MTLRQFFRKYSEIYTVFLPLTGVFLIIYVGILAFSSTTIIPPGYPIDPETNALLYIHRSLVTIPSVTTYEHAAANFLNSYLTSQGWTVELQSVSATPERVNVFAYRGKTRENKVLFTSHIDTVPPFIPYSVHDGYIWGRGSVDAKASVAAQIVAVSELLESGAVGEGDIALLYVVGEETDGIGMITANDLNLEFETAIFGEPTESKLAVGHKGLILADVYATGLASHSGYPELGIDANYYLIEALYKMQHLTYPVSELLGNTTFNAGTLDGGVAANVVSATATSSLAIRVAADTEMVVSILKQAVLDIPHVELNVTLTYSPVICDYDVPGFDTYIANYGTDIPHLMGTHKRYLYGPGSILYAHADNERIGEQELVDSVTGYKQIAAHALGVSLKNEMTEKKET
ncbi:hypothetical protein V1512DRAFT_270791 [Lipomyces arxii]|uniref:uncharacterized protein n=1 Tax=Lipomyces arxii TaxID=56418 RepID=UPI0034CFE37E